RLPRRRGGCAGGDLSGGGWRGRAERDGNADRGCRPVRPLAVAPVPWACWARRAPVILLSAEPGGWHGGTRATGGAGTDDRRLRAGRRGPAAARPRRLLWHTAEWSAGAKGGDDGRYAAAGARPRDRGMAVAARSLFARARTCAPARACLPL